MARNHCTALILFLIIPFFPACGSGDGSSSYPNETERHVLTLKDFQDDPRLRADPRNLVAVLFPERPEWVPAEQGCGEDCMASVPYALDRDATLRFEWQDFADDADTFVVLRDQNDRDVIIIEPGGYIETDLAAGRYSLLLYRTDKEDRTALYLRPVPDIAENRFDPLTTPYPEGLSIHSGGCENCNLAGGNLFQGVMEGNDFLGADLSGANLFQANLGDAAISGADMEGANLYQTKLDSARLDETTLRGANAFQADFSDATLMGAKMAGISSPEASFRRANLQSADISGAIMKYINAEQADFSHANLKSADLAHSILNEAIFLDADLTEADLTGASVTDADFFGADMTDATWITGNKCTGSSIESCW